MYIEQSEQEDLLLQVEPMSESYASKLSLSNNKVTNHTSCGRVNPFTLCK